MIRAETPTDWLLVSHPDHARLAGVVADAWGNDTFARPEPYDAIRYAVYHHDDGWFARDAAPRLTPAGLPEAFTQELVGGYAAFEEIDLPAYLKVRGNATAEVAAKNPTAGVLVSMHTVNLLTEQADMNSIQPEHRDAHANFVAAQQNWQTATIRQLGLDPAHMQRGFEFLQCCDSLSLIVCSGYTQARPLRHQHPDRRGLCLELFCRPVEPHKWQIDPWPFASSAIHLELPYRTVPKDACTDQPSFAAAYAEATIETAELQLV